MTSPEAADDPLPTIGCARCYEEGNSQEGVSLVKPAPHTAVIAMDGVVTMGRGEALSIQVMSLALDKRCLYIRELL